MESGNNIPLLLILAVSENGVIGRGNGLPWHLPDDLQHFKRTTLGCPVLMGRKTFDTVGRPLPGRTNLILTRDGTWTAPGAEAFQNLDEALRRGAEQALRDGAPAMYCVGGAEIYRAVLSRAQGAVVTLVHGHVEGDAHFDMSTLSDWREVSREFFPGGDRNSHDFSILELALPSRS